MAGDLRVGLLLTARVDGSVARAFRSGERAVTRARSVASRAFTAGRQGARQQAAATEDAGHATGRLARALGGLTRRYRESAAAASRLNRETAKTGAGAGGLLDRVRGQAAGLTGGAAATLGTAGAIRATLSREDAEIRLRTVLSGEDADATLETFAERARGFAAKNPVPVGDILASAYSLKSAGLSDATALVGSTFAAQVAKATGGEAERTTEVLAGTFLNLGKTLSGDVEQRFRRVGDVLGKTQLFFKLRDFNQLGEGFKVGAQAAGEYRISLEETAAAIGTLNSASIEGSQAGTALSAMLRQLHKKKTQDVFNADVITRRADGSLDLLATLERVQEIAADIEDTKGIDARIATLKEAFGDEGGLGLQALLNNFDLLRTGLTGLHEADGTVDEAFKRYAEGGSGPLLTLRNNIENLADAFGGHLTPHLRGFAGMLSSGIAPVAAFVRGLDDTAGSLAALTAGAVVAGGGVVAARAGSRVLLGQARRVLHGASATAAADKAEADDVGADPVRDKGKGNKGRGHKGRGHQGRGVMPVRVTNWPLGSGFGTDGKKRASRGSGGKTGAPKPDTPRSAAPKQSMAAGAFATVKRGRALPVRGLPMIGTGLALAGGVLEVSNAVARGDTEEAIEAGAGTAGGLAGAFAGGKLGGVAGAAIGSIVPGLGTAIGGAIGGVAGGGAGYLLGDAVVSDLAAAITDFLTDGDGPEWDKPPPHFGPGGGAPPRPDQAARSSAPRAGPAVVITVNPAAGQDEEAIAEALQRRIEDTAQRQRHDAATDDGGGFWSFSW